MKYVDEFRDAETVRRQLADLRRAVTRRWVIMDVCGGQTHAFLRFGLEAALEDVLEIVHGPGCPVCVTPGEVIDEAIRLACEEGVMLATFGDLLRVPGTHGSLQSARSAGADVRMVYSPLDAVQLAERNPARGIVFFAVGFETTVPATALAVLHAERRKIANFRVLTHHVRVEPAMRALLSQPNCRVQAFLAAGHVCTVTGFRHYDSLVEEFQVPIVVTGFEPVDLLAGLSACVRLLEAGQADLINAYPRTARLEGNVQGRRLADQVFQVATIPWRGFGMIPNGGLVLRPEFQSWDASHHWPSRMCFAAGDQDCRSAEVLSGQLRPIQCPQFGTTCTPDTPRGAPMVSSEGACAAYFQFGQRIQGAT